MDIQKRGLRIKSKVCSLDNQIKRSGLRISHSEVFSSDLSLMLVKKQMKYFDVPLEHAWTVSVLQELLNTRMNNLYVEGFDDYVITEMINMLCVSKNQCFLLVHNFAYFFSFLLETCIFKNIYLNKF